MNIELKGKVNLMVENYKELKGNFKWDTNILKHFCAMMNATRSEKVNIDKIKEIKKYIKEETGLISDYRGNNLLIMASLLCFEEDYKSFFKNMVWVHEKMSQYGFRKSPYLPLATYTIVKDVPEEQWNHKIQRMDEFYKSMKKNHFWLTSTDDYVFAAVLAATELDVKETMEKIEECYKVLSEEGFWKGNDLQTLSHIMALGEESVYEKCKKANSLYNKLKSEKCKLKYSGLATLGVLTLICEDENEIVREVKEVNDFIYEKDGYGMWSLDKSMRTILSANLVSDFYIDEMKKGVLKVALANSINAIIIAQEQAAIAACIAASAAASSSSSSS
ncbi:DUF4003 domain-containing protein [Clostridium sp. P21]|uniref:DUF4003 domain-containing protein n=1 Tax=Clostridium muellerianum TaxID=2716538 RepID=A0A7Y0EET7_9CLOT|nr:DUF4003 domain-containing protein [Clostridium muellerianum]NMM61782.1 DUF4003 domain-containing protein [Clostridium muellerianum]